ncbi:GIY-YIG nuclease family protein [Pseudoxanthomonas sp. F37]|uniref:GIY-YIG nuclease family protein n=1 Tax=Pseudoxanthomonas sp. F37 TaxID=2932492 RepID=UPI001FD42FA2|nr:GIY-YIG nuclease family protein [Pseudoxanthomonas sp. F37]UOV09234.1 GIY-YIG nuclease family protein [Pseudoxanthomonas sp. F37]
MTDRNYYVYVYIDPRNYEEFYYGKGKGSRRFAHLFDDSDSEKVARIRAIEAEGLQPIIRTVAAGLSEAEAHLIETTLIWKLGKGLTNKAAGRFVSLFRPRNTLHRELSSFDFQNGIYYVNVGEGSHRNWDDCRRLGFLSAGQGPQWRDQILDLAEGDVVVAYLKGSGYVGVGKVLARAVPYLDYRHEGRLLEHFDLVAKDMAENSDSVADSEYVLRVEWIVSVPRTEAKWEPNSGLYTTPLVRASLERQPQTISFVENAFGVQLRELAT